MHENFLGFDHMHKGKNIFFCVFWKEGINLYFFEFLNFLISFGENRVFLIPSLYFIV
jgi:hypothetical protein